MRDVSAKVKTLRVATARATLTCSPDTLNLIREGKVPKGDPLPVAKVAAVQAAKSTPQIIPYCHHVPLDWVDVSFELAEKAIIVTVTAKTLYKTGVEMEALTGASVAALTLYDMLKMMDEAMTIDQVVLLGKQGGKSDFKQSFAASLKAGVVVMSDSIASGQKSDRSGQYIVARLQQEGLEVIEYRIIPDDPAEIRQTVLDYVDGQNLDLVVTTGGTGISPRDNTPEALRDLLERELPGIAETIRAYGQERTPYSMLSRAIAGTRGKSLVVCLPGSTGGVQDSLDALFPSVLHAFKMLWGGRHDESRSVEEIQAL